MTKILPILKPSMPPELRKLLVAEPKAKAKWESLTPIGRRDFISWIESAKQPETRRRRIESAPSRLASGKRRPCCYALVPMNLYKALAIVSKAKAEWKKLDPDERRDFTDWINKAEGSDMRAKRINKTCKMLSLRKKPY